MLMSDGTGRSMGNGFGGQLGVGTLSEERLPVRFELGCVAVEVVAGSNHNWARCEDGSIKFWGSNQNGQAGVSQWTQAETPTTITTFGADIVQIGAGSEHSCLRRAVDGEVHCAGGNEYGQLGRGGNADSSSPQKVDLYDCNPAVDGTCTAREGSLATHLVTGESFNLVLGVDSTLTALNGWGKANEGQLLTNDDSVTYHDTPVHSTNLFGELVQLWALRSPAACGLINKDGIQQFKCWGSNINRALGTMNQQTMINQGQAYRTTPVTPGGDNFFQPGDLIDLIGGYGFACVIVRTTGGGVMCWGRNDYGQCGQGFVTPIVPGYDGLNSGLSDPAFIAYNDVGTITNRIPSAMDCGIDHCCAVFDTQLYCWGRNHKGRAHHCMIRLPDVTWPDAPCVRAPAALAPCASAVEGRGALTQRTR